jgi:hypothetical protein
MTNSRRRTPIFPITTAESEKQFKRAENRRERRAAKIAIEAGNDAPSGKAFGDPWNGDKDGRAYWTGAGEEEMMK